MEPVRSHDPQYEDNNAVTVSPKKKRSLLGKLHRIFGNTHKETPHEKHLEISQVEKIVPDIIGLETLNLRGTKMKQVAVVSVILGMDSDDEVEEVIRPENSTDERPLQTPSSSDTYSTSSARTVSSHSQQSTRDKHSHED
jgi:predicted CopG family antitoxin